MAAVKHTETVAELCKRAADGSPWAALLVCIEVNPNDLPELLRIVGPKRGEGSFDACADAWSMYLDALGTGIWFAA